MTETAANQQPSPDQPSADTPARPRRQEQESATDVITELAPGVLRSQLPISLPGLGHVNCYLLEDSRGVALVDPGLPDKESYVALQARLKSAGVPLKHVHTVVVTHSHPDHFGGAYQLRKDTGADIVTHAKFRVMWDPREPPDLDPDDAAEIAPRRFPWDPSPWGGTGMAVPWKRRMYIKVARRVPRLMRLPQPTVRLEEAQPHVLAGREWFAVHTPGHTDDHLCLFDPTEGLFLCGDHVLPTITPHIGGMVRHPDPLAQFFDSLDKVAELGPQVRLNLPAHGHPFADLAGRAQEIKEHHAGRLQKLRDTGTELGRPATVMEMSRHLFQPRSWGPMAESETYAHLEHLRLCGDMDRHDGAEGYEYVLTD